MDNNDQSIDTKLFKDILSKIDSHLSNIDKPSILITSDSMTKSIIQTGISSLYKDKINFVYTLSNPYSFLHADEIQKVIYLFNQPDVILVLKKQSLNIVYDGQSFANIFKDMHNVKVVNREIDVIDIALNNTDKKVVFLSIDYELNSPSLAGLILEAHSQNISNLTIMLNNKLLPPAVRNFLDINSSIDAFIAPGDLSILIGMQAWDFIPQNYNIPVAVGGFDRLSILKSLEAVLGMLEDHYYSVFNCYSELVSANGNPVAQNLTYKVFSPKTALWHAYGLIPFSGLTFNDEYVSYDAENLFDFSSISKLKVEYCDNVLKAKIEPDKCPQFKVECNFDHPLGSYMANDIGLCNLCLKNQISKTTDINDYKTIAN